MRLEIVEHTANTQIRICKSQTSYDFPDLVGYNIYGLLEQYSDAADGLLLWSDEATERRLLAILEAAAVASLPTWGDALAAESLAVTAGLNRRHAEAARRLMEAADKAFCRLAPRVVLL
ncbi:hypothetical protein ABB55_08505 [Prosthecomicrobium hirschii]|uniref:Uncharacterized protein n=1 Tax=Prosthecodimorpha hirschii TaxID=665126 RepID=A0A0P6WC79_9HYPH|nr:hypothetical protein [Prosthecomicrobium hirschii]KPL52267.1 hypothetical protein ABB55_08505 [Prosthecomicrobium hirschii]